jgi:DNA-binding SARP family transcriptional activator
MLRVRVVGGLGAMLDDQPLQTPAGRPARALLGWLAIHPGRHARGRVAAALWPDFTDESARANLRTALSAVRDALGVAAGAALLVDRQSVGLAGLPVVAVDVHEFAALLDAGRPAEAIAALGSGEVLPDLDFDWVFREQDRMRECVSHAMADLATAAEARGDHAEAIDWLRQRTERDPFDEQAHRDLIAAMDRAGDRAGAIVVYERLSERLRRELGVAPSGVTRGLAASLRADHVASTARGAVPEPERPELPPRLDPARWRGVFVGRDDALARLHAAWAGVQRGGMAFVIAIGEAGIGKSRLAALFAAEVHAAGATVLAGAAEEDAARPCAPIMEALGTDLDPAGGSATDRLIDDTVARARLQAECADALERKAHGRPLLLVLDDMHWSDPETLACLRYLAHRGLAVPALTVLTTRLGHAGRGTPLAEALSAISRDAGLGRVELSGLDRSEAAALVAGREQSGVLADSELEALVARTDGNPFFIGALLDAGLTGAGAAMPADVAELIASRVHSLGPAVERTLEAGAILGREFDPSLTAAVAGIGLDDVLAALDRATAAHLVTSAVGHPGGMAFIHALVQDALTSRLTSSQRRALHVRAVEALELRVPVAPDATLAATAGHALAAVPAISVERAADLAERAAIELKRVHAQADAADLLARALEACDGASSALAIRARLRLELGETLQAADLGNNATPMFETALSQARRLGDGALLARAALGLAGPAVAIVAVDHTRVALLEEALAGLEPGEAELRARLQARMAVELAYDEDQVRRDALSREALTAARSVGDSRILSAALGARHVVLWGPDHTRERLPLTAEMLSLALRAEDPALELQARTWRIVDLEELGDGAGVEAELEAYAMTAARMPLSAYAWYVPAWRAARALLAGRIEQSHELQRQAARLGHRAGDPNVQFVERLHFILAFADERAEEIDLLWQTDRVRNSPVRWAYRAALAWAMASAGQHDEARREIRAQRAAGAPQSWPRDTNWLSAAKELSEAARILDDVELGAELEELLTPFSDRLVVSARALMCIGSVAGALACLAELRGDLDTAIDRYENAIEREERAGALIWATNHRRRLAMALRTAGRHAQSIRLLEAVTRRAPAMGLTRVAGLAQQAREASAESLV